MFNNNYLHKHSKQHFYPDLKQSWILVLIFLSALFASSVFASILITLGINTDVAELIAYMIIVGTLVFTAFFYKKTINDKPFIYYKNKVSVWIYILVIPAIIGLGGFVEITGAMILPEMPDFFKKSLENAMDSNLPTIFTAVVAAPVLEEIVCRGIICEGLIKNISPRAGILWSALIFAVIHLNPWQGLSAFVIGCFLGWIYWKTRSIIPCIFIHFVNNALALFLYYYYCEKSGYDLNTPVSEIYGISETVMIIIYVSMFLASFVLLVKILKPKHKDIITITP
ncbi:MAG: CPBP family intramembrane metalloprotease [Prevotellaceae bacterium]|jgi:membrane protease YdiL (CAAX protease family)|nr:CPBP family intramembrane metalloprotease [Prevotellaceae bacterium]